MLNIKTLHDLVNSEEYQSYISDKLGNDLFLSDPDRADRLQKFAEEGGDGSTHSEVIDDQKEFLNSLKIFDPDFDDFDDIDDIKRYDLKKSIYDFLLRELKDVKQWHEKNGSLYEIIN